jgi:Tfp pilus assembly protein PilO
MKLGPREIIFLVLLMAIPLAAWQFVFQPQNERNAQLTRQIECRQERLRELNQAVARIGDLRKEIESLEQAVKFFQSKLPNEKEIDKVLKEVWRLAESNQLTAKSIRTLGPGADKAPIATPAGPAEQPIAMQLEGDFRGFYGFLQSLENQPRIMRIKKMVLEKLKKGPEGHIEAKFDMSIFFERSAKEEPCPDRNST